MRIGVLYPDGSMNVMAPGPNAEAQAIEEALSAKAGAVIVSVDLDDSDVVELGPEDLK